MQGVGIIWNPSQIAAAEKQEFAVQTFREKSAKGLTLFLGGSKLLYQLAPTGYKTFLELMDVKICSSFFFVNF